MQIITEREARARWLAEGMNVIFRFEEYINLLERTHIMVLKSGGIRGKIDEKEHNSYL